MLRPRPVPLPTASSCKRDRRFGAVLHAGAVVRDLDTQTVANGLGANPDFAGTAFFLDGIHGVVQDIEEDLLKLMEISAGHGQVADRIRDGSLCC